MGTASRLGMHGLVRERGRVHQVLGVPGGRIGAGHHEPRWCLSLGRIDVDGGVQASVSSLHPARTHSGAHFLGYLLG
jgi:hypothetical protein